MKIIFAKFPNGKIPKIIFWCIIFLLLLGALAFLRLGKATITKEEVLDVVYNTQQAQNYRWHIVSEIEFKGVHNVLSDVYGDKNKDTFRIRGNFLKTPLEIIQIENMTYRLDSITKQWLVLRNDNLVAEEVLTTELNPVAALNFAAIKNFTTTGVASEGSSKTFRIELMPDVASRYLIKFWEDFHYTLLVGKDKQYLQGYELSARSKKDPTGKVIMKVYFSDFEKVKAINPPL